MKPGNSAISPLAETGVNHPPPPLLSSSYVGNIRQRGEDGRESVRWTGMTILVLIWKLHVGIHFTCPSDRAWLTTWEEGSPQRTGQAATTYETHTSETQLKTPRSRLWTQTGWEQSSSPSGERLRHRLRKWSPDTHQTSRGTRTDQLRVAAYPGNTTAMG